MHNPSGDCAIRREISAVKTHCATAAAAAAVTKRKHRYMRFCLQPLTAAALRAKAAMKGKKAQGAFKARKSSQKRGGGSARGEGAAVSINKGEEREVAADAEAIDFFSSVGGAAQ